MGFKSSQVTKSYFSGVAKTTNQFFVVEIASEFVCGD